MQRRKPPFLWTGADSEEVGLKLSLERQRVFQERKSGVGQGAAGRGTSMCNAPEHKSWLWQSSAQAKGNEAWAQMQPQRYLPALLRVSQNSQRPNT